MTARISVVLPVYDREAYVAEALASVLSQTRPPDEVIVVDDGSSDGSVDAVERVATPIVRIVRQSNGGISAARNRGLDESTGDLVAFIDSDDIWAPEKLARQERVLETSAEIALVFGYIEEFLSPEREEALEKTVRVKDGPLPGVIASTLLVRREAIDQIGPFDVAYQVGEFIDWLARSRDLGLQSATLSETVARRRIHGHNTVMNRSNGDYLRVLKRTLDRRRRKAAHGG